MTIEQTIDVPASHPASHRLTIEDIDMDGECPLDHTPNAETIAAIREGRAMMRGEIPSPTFHSIEELLADLRN